MPLTLFPSFSSSSFSSFSLLEWPHLLHWRCETTHSDQRSTFFFACLLLHWDTCKSPGRAAHLLPRARSSIFIQKGSPSSGYTSCVGSFSFAPKHRSKGSNLEEPWHAQMFCMSGYCSSTSLDLFHFLSRYNTHAQITAILLSGVREKKAKHKND